MAKPQKLLVPVRLTGGILHDTDYARGAESVEDAAHIDNDCFDRTGHMRWGAEYVRAEVPAFTTRLRVVETGHKSAYVWLVDEDMGHRWPMFTSDYVALMTRATVTDGWIEPTTYETCKKGARAYGIRATNRSA
jgi:hypothetical protein